MSEVAGEPHDHQHQRGSYFGHADVNGVDFWANEESYKTTNRGREAPAGPVAIRGSSIILRLNWTDPRDIVLLEERRTITFHPDSDRRVMDFDTTLTAKQRVTFGDEKDGLFAIRLRPE